MLESSLKEHLFGQHIARDVITHAIKAHFNGHIPGKALVLSFNGLPGGGKTFVSQFIIKSLYKSGLRSRYVHFFNGRTHFGLESKTDIYKVNIYTPFFTVGRVQILVVIETCETGLTYLETCTTLRKYLVCGANKKLNH